MENNEMKEFELKENTLEFAIDALKKVNAAQNAVEEKKKSYN